MYFIQKYSYFQIILHLTGIEPASSGPEPNALSTKLKVQIILYFNINKKTRQPLRKIPMLQKRKKTAFSAAFFL